MIDLSEKKVGEIIPMLYWVKEWNVSYSGAITSSKPEIQVKKFTKCKLTEYRLEKGWIDYTLKGVNEKGKECEIWYRCGTYSNGDEKVEWLFENKEDAFQEYLRYSEMWKKHLVNNIRMKLSNDLKKAKEKLGC